ncbi:hypothetical protein LZ32DRAFT_460723 [Colletotrichum eremochloae]|nr:hypothetical protein LZ32DRAFT_460723 [Colletotrichum eremochloae]
MAWHGMALQEIEGRWNMEMPVWAGPPPCHHQSRGLFCCNNRVPSREREVAAGKGRSKNDVSNKSNKTDGACHLKSLPALSFHLGDGSAGPSQSDTRPSLV